MLNRFLQRIYFRIYISKYISDLESLGELYAKGDKDSYLRQMEIFYAELLRFLQLYNRKVQKISPNNEVIVPFSISPEDSPINFYSSHAELLLKLEQSFKSKNASELHRSSQTIGQFLDKLYNVVLPGKKSVTRSRYSVTIGIVITLILAGILYSPLKARYSKEKEKYNFLVNEEAYKEQTLKDILALKEALQKYYIDKKGYPKSKDGWNTVISPSGKPDSNWIQGLAPKYIKELPVDPRKSQGPVNQYMYRSDGTDFKLIAHFPVGMDEIIKKHPELIDAARPSWAYGIWSQAAKTW